MPNTKPTLRPSFFLLLPSCPTGQNKHEKLTLEDFKGDCLRRCDQLEVTERRGSINTHLDLELAVGRRCRVYCPKLADSVAAGTA